MNEQYAANQWNGPVDLPGPKGLAEPGIYLVETDGQPVAGLSGDSSTAIYLGSGEIIGRRLTNLESSVAEIRSLDPQRRGEALGLATALHGQTWPHAAGLRVFFAMERRGPRLQVRWLPVLSEIPEEVEHRLLTGFEYRFLELPPANKTRKRNVTDPIPWPF